MVWMAQVQAGLMQGEAGLMEQQSPSQRAQLMWADTTAGQAKLVSAACLAHLRLLMHQQLCLLMQAALAPCTCRAGATDSCVTYCDVAECHVAMQLLCIL